MYIAQTIPAMAATLPVAALQVGVQGIGCLLGVQVLLQVPGCHGPAGIQAHAANGAAAPT